MKLNIQKIDRKILFQTLDNMRKEDPKKYAKIVNENEDDLFDVGYLKHTIQE